WEHSNVEYRDGQIVAYDKRAPTARMHHVDYGLGVFASSAIARIEPGQNADLATLYQELLWAEWLPGTEVSERFYEIGSFEGLEETRRLLAARRHSNVARP